MKSLSVFAKDLLRAVKNPKKTDSDHCGDLYSDSVHRDLFDSLLGSVQSSGKAADCRG